ncbi:bacterial transcriptional activator domain-containing protein [Ktedonobacter sp. SOSP1-52]|uniref:bacterial transcriptional activator domain-containing protein n=1 Tax=Ktedonobacter sp. SOSP1-52 TaxID=2778366 RepID=UPI001915D2E2
MRLHALRGDRAALRTYHACAKILDRELGTEPGEATRTLYESYQIRLSSIQRRPPMEGGSPPSRFRMSL